jgi:hypothetical protein
MSEKSVSQIVITKEKMLSRYRSKDDRDEKRFFICYNWRGPTAPVRGIDGLTAIPPMRWWRSRATTSAHQHVTKSIPSIQKTIRLSTMSMPRFLCPFTYDGLCRADTRTRG